MQLNKQTAYIQDHKSVNFAACFLHDGAWYHSVGISPVSNCYVLTPEELLELKKKWAGEAFDAGDTYRTCVVEDWDGSGEGNGSTPNKPTYINSLSI